MEISLEEKRRKHAEYMKKYFAERPDAREKRRAYGKKRYEENKERHSIKCKEWRDKNKERIALKNKERYTLHKEEMKIKTLEYREKNRKLLCEKQKIYQLNNRAKRNEYHRKRYHKSKMVRVGHFISGRIYKDLRKRKDGQSWEKLVGYTIEDLFKHLESQFVEGMSWDNYGKWHIDHIKPMSSFHYESPFDDEFKQCWSLKNLQPLWAEENLKKGARLDWKRTGT